MLAVSEAHHCALPAIALDDLWTRNSFDTTTRVYDEAAVFSPCVAFTTTRCAAIAGWTPHQSSFEVGSKCESCRNSLALYHSPSLVGVYKERQRFGYADRVLVLRTYVVKEPTDNGSMFYGGTLDFKTLAYGLQKVSCNHDTTSRCAALCSPSPTAISHKKSVCTPFFSTRHVRS